MFYENQNLINQDRYKTLLKLISKLSKLFSENESPYLHYRIHENFFCECFEGENLSRSDVSIDAKKDLFGIGLKTWVGNNNQKIAEFNKVSNLFNGLTETELILLVSELRNERLRFTKNSYRVEKLIYHVVRRRPGIMQILETPMSEIQLESIILENERGSSNSIYFNDGLNNYHFSMAKNTLYKDFGDLIKLDEFNVAILENPVELLESNSQIEKQIIDSLFKDSVEQRLVLRLYSNRGNEKVVFTKSGINGWNALGRKRDINEIYIQYPKFDRERSKGFFPDKNQPFDIRLPSGDIISAKVCQQDGKAIMSNPNKALGKWLLRDLLEIKEGRIVTYQDLEKVGVDSIIFTKQTNNLFKLDFGELGFYENMIEESY